MPRILLDHVTIGYRELGQRTQPTVVFAHPMLWGPDTFRDLLAGLAQDFHVIALDIHGHGASGVYSGMTLETMADDFREALGQLGAVNVAWLGISIGGMLGMRLALRSPRWIDRLILMSTTAQLDPPPLRGATLELWKRYCDGAREEVADPALPFFFSPTTMREHPEIVAAARRQIIEAGDVGGMFEAAMAAFDRGDLSDRIGGIDVPTLILQGRDDPMTGPAQAEFLASTIPGAELTIVEDANHLLALEKPMETLERIRRFLQRT